MSLIGLPVGRQCFKLAVANLVEAVVYGITIIGLPLARQSLKLARLSLMPFGKRVVR